MTYKLREEDVLKGAEVITAAFRGDPLWTKIFENVSGFDEKYSSFFELGLRYAFKYGEIIAPSTNLEGAAAWVPGELSYMTFYRMLRCGALLRAMRLGPLLGSKMRYIFTPLEKDRKKNMNGRDFIYLFMIGVNPDMQGMGFGKKMLEELIRKSETADVSLYLETETPENVELYEHFGFKTLRRIDLPVINLPMWEMERSPRSRAITL